MCARGPVIPKWTAARLRPAAETGGVLVSVVLFLPVLVALMGLVLELGRLFVVARVVQTAADLGALAGSQEVDLGRLAEGERLLDEERARAQAESVTRENLMELGGSVAETSRVRVYVINVTGGPTTHPRTGRLIRDPTVSVWVEATVPVWGVWWKQEARVGAHADASVVEKRSSRR